MSSRRDPALSLDDIVNSAARAARHMVGLDQDAFRRDELVRDAVERCIERACEAVYRLGPEAERLMPGQPWTDIRGMGNRLRHAYDGIDIGVVWETATVWLPKLAGAAALALASLDDT